MTLLTDPVLFMFFVFPQMVFWAGFFLGRREQRADTERERREQSA